MTLNLPTTLSSLTSAPAHPARADAGCADADFAFIADAFRSMGGFCMADEMAAHLRCLSRGGVGEVARWIVRREVLNVH